MQNIHPCMKRLSGEMGRKSTYFGKKKTHKIQWHQIWSLVFRKQKFRWPNSLEKVRNHSLLNFIFINLMPYNGSKLKQVNPFQLWKGKSTFSNASQFQFVLSCSPDMLARINTWYCLELISLCEYIFCKKLQFMHSYITCRKVTSRF